MKYLSLLKNTKIQINQPDKMQDDSILFTLPVEIRQFILEFLTIEQVKAFGRTSRQAYFESKDKKLWNKLLRKEFFKPDEFVENPISSYLETIHARKKAQKSQDRFREIAEDNATSVLRRWGIFHSSANVEDLVCMNISDDIVKIVTCWAANYVCAKDFRRLWNKDLDYILKTRAFKTFQASIIATSQALNLAEEKNKKNGNLVSYLGQVIDKLLHGGHTAFIEIMLKELILHSRHVALIERLVEIVSMQYPKMLPKLLKDDKDIFENLYINGILDEHKQIQKFLESFLPELCHLRALLVEVNTHCRSTNIAEVEVDENANEFLQTSSSTYQYSLFAKGNSNNNDVTESTLNANSEILSSSTEIRIVQMVEDSISALKKHYCLKDIISALEFLVFPSDDIDEDSYFAHVKLLATFRISYYHNYPHKIVGQQSKLPMDKDSSLRNMIESYINLALQQLKKEQTEQTRDAGSSLDNRH